MELEVEVELDCCELDGGRDDEVLDEVEEGGGVVDVDSSLVLVEVGDGLILVLVVLGGSGEGSGASLPSVKCHSP